MVQLDILRPKRAGVRLGPGPDSRRQGCFDATWGDIGQLGQLGCRLGISWGIVKLAKLATVTRLATLDDETGTLRGLVKPGALAWLSRPALARVGRGG